ncbi:hypothetical protein METSCH_A07500 [Metschnikowia aff. pulcherrima]|uniref:Uncharacterized protein n=1 Tax=Metschnikowia aff. pulcherrima TaxID=2163413 RepID=A0A4P6XKM7_9ASCO|nr:hypothetical protein METSCH_A07500 [Metschnikowia aff. pulcherrima]
MCPGTAALANTKGLGDSVPPQQVYSFLVCCSGIPEFVFVSLSLLKNVGICIIAWARCVWYFARLLLQASSLVTLWRRIWLLLFFLFFILFFLTFAEDFCIFPLSGYMRAFGAIPPRLMKIFTTKNPPSADRPAATIVAGPTHLCRALSSLLCAALPFKENGHLCLTKTVNGKE